VETTLLVQGAPLGAMQRIPYHRIGHTQPRLQELVASAIGLDRRHQAVEQEVILVVFRAWVEEVVVALHQRTTTMTTTTMMMMTMTKTKERRVGLQVVKGVASQSRIRIGEVRFQEATWSAISLGVRHKLVQPQPHNLDLPDRSRGEGTPLEVTKLRVPSFPILLFRKEKRKLRFVI
jgi:hypothetical protein